MSPGITAARSEMSRVPAADSASVVCRMDEKISATLAQIADLRLPVVRTSHLGNTTANNFGWLALAQHTYLSPIDHNLHGVDDIYFPWALLGPGGRVVACFNHRGEPQPQWVGQPAAALRHSVPPEYCAFLSFGLRAEQDGRDLIAEHLQVTRELSWQCNRSVPRPRSAELVDLKPLLVPLIHDFYEQRQLHLLFNRWVERTPRGYLKMYKLRHIEYRAGGEVLLFTDHARPRFVGSLALFLEQLFAGWRQVQARLLHSAPLPERGYAWITGVFNLLLNAVKEAQHDPTQRVFWHAAAATNHLYIQAPDFQHDFAALAQALIHSGHLPAGCELRFIPSFSCQLFATDPLACAQLDDLIDCFCAALKPPRHGLAPVKALAASPEPATVARAWLAEIAPRVRQELRLSLTRLNALSEVHLPIAYISGAHPIHPATYNKSGVAQRQLLGKNLYFPAALTTLAWGEAELLIRSLAELVAGESA